MGDEIRRFGEPPSDPKAARKYYRDINLDRKANAAAARQASNRATDQGRHEAGRQHHQNATRHDPQGSRSAKEKAKDRQKVANQTGKTYKGVKPQKGKVAATAKSSSGGCALMGAALVGGVSYLLYLLGDAAVMLLT